MILKNKYFHINFPRVQKCLVPDRRPPTPAPPLPSLPLLRLNLPPPLVVVAACHWHPLSADKSLEPPTAGDMAATAAAKLRLENHLNMLKMKEIEMMKTVPVNRTFFFSIFSCEGTFTVFFCRFATSFFSRCFRCKWQRHFRVNFIHRLLQLKYEEVIEETERRGSQIRKHIYYVLYVQV